MFDGNIFVYYIDILIIKIRGIYPRVGILEMMAVILISLSGRGIRTKTLD